jgi:rod shape-determining protein MreC
MAGIPRCIGNWQEKHIRSRQRLLEDNDRLRRENLVLQGRSQQLASLQADNARLRALLNSTALLRDDVLVSEVIGVSPDPVRHQLVLDKGGGRGVYGPGAHRCQRAHGAGGGDQCHHSRVLLITDPTHSVPVQVNRNGVRAVAEGVGSLDRLAVHHVAATTDIEVGDLLVTSGLGGRFPIGYPVAVVSEVERNPGEAFARVIARPTAALDRARHALLVFRPHAPETPRQWKWPVSEQGSGYWVISLTLLAAAVLAVLPRSIPAWWRPEWLHWSGVLDHCPAASRRAFYRALRRPALDVMEGAPIGQHMLALGVVVTWRG